MYFYNKGATKSYMNNKLVNESSWNMDYNGKNLNVNALIDDDQYFISLNNTDIQNLLQHKNFLSSNMSLKHKLNNLNTLSNNNKPVEKTKNKNKKTNKQTNKKHKSTKKTNKKHKTRKISKTPKYKCIRIK